MTNIPNDEAEIRKIKSSLTDIDVDIKLLRLRRKAGFNPNQPRVPSGNPDGGQWSDDGFSGGGQSGSDTPRGIAKNPATVAPQGRDVATARVATRVGPRHSPDRPQVRYTVTLPGQRRFGFQTDGKIQTVFNGSNRPISRTIWTPNGPMPLPTVQRVSAIGTRDTANLQTSLKTAQETFEAARQLYNYLSATASEGLRACLAFTAKEFRPGGEIVPHLNYVGTLTRAETATVCTKLDLVQRLSNEAFAEAKRAGPYPNAAVFGTAVHARLRQKILTHGGPTLKAEFSLLKKVEEEPLDFSAIRVDVIENRGEGPICVYDLKTGKRGLSGPRTAEFAIRLLKHGRPIIVIEVRPNE